MSPSPEINLLNEPVTEQESVPADVYRISEILQRVIETYRFDVLTMYASFARGIESGLGLADIINHWSPRPVEETRENGGSDCYGLVAVLEAELTKAGIEGFSPFPFNTSGLPEGSLEATRDIGHVGLFKWISNEEVMILDPGFAINSPIVISRHEPELSYCSIDGREFKVKVDFENQEGQVQVSASYHPEKKFGFKLSSLSYSELGNAQKAFLKVRSTIHCDSFDRQGKKIAGLKINLPRRTVSLWTGEESVKINFSDWGKEGSRTNLENFSQKLKMPLEHLKEYVNLVIRNSNHFPQMWIESQRQNYKEENKLLLNSGVGPNGALTGESIGGVLAFITDGNGRLALHEISESDAIPKLGRHRGQLNTMVESGEIHELSMENGFWTNLERGFNEEIGESIQSFRILQGSYRETRYGVLDPHSTARCCVISPNDPEIISRFNFRNASEGGKWEWYPVNEVLTYNLEPNTRIILEQYMEQGILGKIK